MLLGDFRYRHLIGARVADDLDAVPQCRQGVTRGSAAIQDGIEFGFRNALRRQRNDGVEPARSHARRRIRRTQESNPGVQGLCGLKSRFGLIQV